MSDDQPSISEIIRGLSDPDDSLAEHGLLLLQLLVNKAAEIAAGESSEPVAFEVVISVYAYCLQALTKEKDPQKVNLLLSTLANITIIGEHAEAFMNLIAEDSSRKTEVNSGSSSPCVAAFRTVLSIGLNSYNPQDEKIMTGSDISDPDSFWESNDPWQHTMSLLCNLSTLEVGRRLLTQQSTRYMEKLALQIKSKNPCRRRGALASVRSCLFDTEVHWWMVHEINIVTSVLLPLVVATPFTEQEKKGMDPVLWMRAENPDTKADSIVDLVKLSLDCITLLCQTRPIREDLRKRQVYPVCRNLDYAQEDEGVNASIYEIVQFLMRDEEPLTAEESKK